jgi:trigger factor
MLRLRRGGFRKVEDRPAAEDDVPICHVAAIHNGEEVWRETELPADLSLGSIGGMAVPGLKDALTGAKIGESKALKVTLPAEFAVEEHRGKEVDLEVTVDEIRHFEAPAATDEWAKSLGFEGMKDLREELHGEIRREREHEADDIVQERIAEQLLQLTDFEVPAGLVERLVASTKERQRLAMLYRGVPREEIDKAIEEREKRTRDSSVQSCKLYFILRKIAEQEKIFVTEEELQHRVQAIALNYQRKPKEVQAELEAEGRLSSLRQEMREEKARDFLLQHATVNQAATPPGEPAPKAEAESQPPAQNEASGEGQAEGTPS